MNCKHTSSVCAILAIVLAAAMPHTALGADFYSWKIVDTEDTMPGTTSKYDANGSDAPAMDTGQIVFNCKCGFSIWSANSDGTGLTQLINSNTPIPGGTGNFDQFYGSQTFIKDGTVVFIGSLIDGGKGIYMVPAQGGAVTKLVDRNDFIPGTMDHFGGFPEFDVNSGTVAFMNGQRAYGISTSGGDPWPVAVASAEGHVDPCCIFGAPALSITATLALITGNVFGHHAVWTVDAGTGDPNSFRLVAKGGMPIPGTPGIVFDPFEFGPPAIDDASDTVVFRGAGGVYAGIYSNSGGGPLLRLVDTTTPVPGGTGTFQNRFEMVAISDGVVVFSGRDQSDHLGLYAVPANGGEISKILAEGDPIGDPSMGYQVAPNGIITQRKALKGDQLGILVAYANFRGGGLYVVGGLSTVLPLAGAAKAATRAASQ